MLNSRLARAALVCLAAVTPVAAQVSAATEPSELARRSSGTVAIVQSRPIGQLSENIGIGYGIAGAYLLRLDRAGFISLRADGGLAQYGDETFRVPLSSTVGGRVQVKVSTNNYMVPLSIGPQLSIPTGLIRPYVNGGIAAQIFYTESSVDGDDSNYDFATTTNQQDWTSTWVAGGGVSVPIYTNKMSVLIDAGVQYFGSGHARYLRPGSIEDLPNSQIRITQFESATHLMLVHLGVKLGL
jgi:hypothetical protein